MKKVWLFLHTEHIGGAEKRFAGLWKALQGRLGAFNLVLKKELYQKFKSDNDIKGELVKYADHIFFLDTSSTNEKLKSLYKGFIDKHANEGDIFHFIGEHPFLRTPKNKQIFSITQSSLKNLNAFGKAGHFLGVMFSDVIDVLDPTIYKIMRSTFFYKKSRIHLTSNSFCDVNYYYALPFEEKKDWLVFLGRFEEVKQVKQLLEAIPALYNELNKTAENDLHFHFIGHGSLEIELRAIVQREAFKNLPITIAYSNKPNEILCKSKIFFSLQLNNNYPSKSLIEAMSAGNIPVVTNVGETQWLAKPEFSYYVPEHFTTDDIVKAVRSVYNEGEKALSEKSKMARQLVMQEHTLEKMRDYYLQLYASLNEAEV